MRLGYGLAFDVLELDLRAEPRRPLTHLNGRLAHALECVPTRLGRRTFLDEVTQYRRACPDREVNVLESLQGVSKQEGWTERFQTHETSSDDGRVPDRIQKGNAYIVSR